jgi:hypothetical protein
MSTKKSVLSYLVLGSLACAATADAQVFQGPFPERAAFSAVNLDLKCGLIGSTPRGMNARGDVVLEGNLGQDRGGVFRYIASTDTCTRLRSTRELERSVGHDRFVGSPLGITEDGTVIVSTQTNIRSAQDSDEATGIVPLSSDRVVVLQRVGNFDEYSTTAVSPRGRIAGLGINYRNLGGAVQKFSWFRELDGRISAVRSFGREPLMLAKIADSGFLVAAYRKRNAEGSLVDVTVGVTPQGNVVELKAPRGVSLNAEEPFGSHVNERGQLAAPGAIRTVDSYQPQVLKFDLKRQGAAAQVLAGEAKDMNNCGSVLASTLRGDPRAGMALPAVYSDSGEAIDISRGLLSQGNEETARVAILDASLINDNHQMVVAAVKLNEVGYPTGEFHSYLITPAADSALAALPCAGGDTIRARSVGKMANALKKAHKAFNSRHLNRKRKN